MYHSYIHYFDWVQFRLPDDRSGVEGQICKSPHDGTFLLPFFARDQIKHGCEILLFSWCSTIEIHFLYMISYLALWIQFFRSVCFACGCLLLVERDAWHLAILFLLSPLVSILIVFTLLSLLYVFCKDRRKPTCVRI